MKRNYHYYVSFYYKKEKFFRDEHGIGTAHVTATEPINTYKDFKNMVNELREGTGFNTIMVISLIPLNGEEAEA